MRKMLCALIAVMLSFAVSVSAGAVSIADFSDVTSSDWYYDAVDYAASNGLFSGTSSTTFSPSTSMTRGMFVTVLGRLANVPDTYGRTLTTPFNDVTQADYFFPFAVWANDNGITTGVGGNLFNPSGEISREQIATILFRYAEKFGYDITYSAEKYAAFADTTGVSVYAVTAMQWATTHGIINGSDGKLSPQDKASRAQVAQIFLNFNKLHADAALPEEPATPVEPGAPDTDVDWQNYNPEYTIPTGKSVVDADGGYYDYDLAGEIIAQVNTLRSENGLDTLLYNPKIQAWAGIRAQEQTIREGHTRPDGTLFGTVGSGLTSENITILLGLSEAQRNDTTQLAKRAVNNWYTSTNGHKEAMLSATSKLGVVACYVKDNNVYIVHLFSNKTQYFMDYLIP